MNIEGINLVIEKIEENLTGEISYRELAGILSVSVYELRRLFSFIVGVPLSDYIRQRRISCAVFDLVAGENTITEIAAKYGYDSPSSFSRAFRELQGISPSEARKKDITLKTYPRVSFNWSVSGTSQIQYKLVQREEMKLCGYSSVSNSDSSDCGETVWNEYFERGYHDRLLQMRAFETQNAEFASYSNGEGSEVICTIGALLPLTAETPEGMDEIIIPAATWGVFEVVGTMPKQMDTSYFRTIGEWLTSSPYIRDAEVCNLEAFPVEEREENDTMPWKIWYPLKKKTEF